MAGVFCPFSGPPGQPSSFCASGQQCCEPPESTGALSVCTSSGTACPVAGSTVWQCEGAPDCAALPGTVCCGTGSIEMEGPQPGCGPGGATVPGFPYVSGFTGTACVPSAMCTGAASFQVCSQNSDCTGDAGLTCTSVAPKGNGIGYCGSM